MFKSGVFSTLIVLTSLIAIGCGSSHHGGSSGGSGSPPGPLQVSSIPDGRVGVPYDSTFPASGGTQPYIFGVSGLPAGLSLNAGTGEVTGTPTVAGPYPMTVTVTDATHATAQQSFTLTIGNPSEAITTTSLANGVVGTAYSGSVQAVGTAPFTWGAVGLPPGLSVNINTGAITGTPTQAGSYTPTFTVTDSSRSGSVSKNIPLTIQ